MIINHNMASLNTYRQLSTNNANSAKSLEKLSSGLRINKAGDDAAGLAISEKMRGQIRGLDQASRNAQDGISMSQTAEGGLSETQSILQRMRELATQASNDTNTSDDRGEIQKEMNQLTSEINRIGNTTEFNTQKLLKGNTTPATGVAGAVTTTTPFDAGTPATPSSGVITFTDAGEDGKKVTVNGFDFNFATTPADIDGSDTSYDVALGTNADTAAAAFKAAFDAAKLDGATELTNLTASVTGGAVTITDSTGAATTMSTDFAASASVNAALAGGAPATPETAAIFKFDITTNLAENDTITVGGKTYTGVTGTAGAGEFQIGADADTTETNLAAVITADTGNTFTAAINGGSLELTQRTAAAGAAPTVTLAGPGGANFTSNLQIGANTGQSFTISIEDMRADALDISSATVSDTKTVTVDGKAYTAKYTANQDVTNGTDSTGAEYALDVSSHDNATAAIQVIDEAINKVSAERSKIGAYQNRLDHTISNLGTSSENLTAAESRVRDVDMAKEMMQFQKNNILSQAAQAMLAQANQAPQGVLQLLR